MKRFSQHRHQLRLIHEISITPLLDVVLVLLFVFMLAAPLLNNGGTLQLPSAGKGAGEPPKDIVPLTMDAAQTITFNGHPVPRTRLKDELITLAKDRPAAGVLVQIHRDLPVQTLVELMDMLRQAGIQRTAVATAQPSHP